MPASESEFDHTKITVPESGCVSLLSVKEIKISRLSIGRLLILLLLALAVGTGTKRTISCPQAQKMLREDNFYATETVPKTNRVFNCTYLFA